MTETPNSASDGAAVIPTFDAAAVAGQIRDAARQSRRLLVRETADAQASFMDAVVDAIAGIVDHLSQLERDAGLGTGSAIKPMVSSEPLSVGQPIANALGEEVGGPRGSLPENRYLVMSDRDRVIHLFDEIDRRVRALEERIDIAEYRIGELAQHARYQLHQAPWPCWLDYLQFTERFRGTRDEIKQRQEVYVEFFRDRAPIIDLGCGRGEFVELLRENKIDVVGIDADRGMVEYCQARDLDVIEFEALKFVSSRPDSSLGGLFMGQVIEHLHPEQIPELVKIAARKLQRDGALVIETVNPVCPAALGSFYLDPTHTRPVHPQLLSFLAERCGFADVNVLYSSPVQPSKSPPFSRSAEHAADYRDYAVVATSPTGTYPEL